MAKTLAERLTSARSTDRINIRDLEQLIVDATAERERLSAAAVAASAESVNFALTDEERDDAAARSARFTRTAQALTAPITELTAKLEAKRDSEGQRANEAERAEIVAERDALAVRLAEEWPLAEAMLLEMVAAIEANDARLRAARLHERSAEAIARQLGPDVHPGIAGISRLADLRLPSFTDPRRLAWPAERGINLEMMRQVRVDAERTLAEQRARWKRVRITPPADLEQPVTIATQAGKAPILRSPVMARMDAAMMAAAETAGCKVELATADMTVGAPSGVAVF